MKEWVFYSKAERTFFKEMLEAYFTKKTLDNIMKVFANSPLEKEKKSDIFNTIRSRERYAFEVNGVTLFPVTDKRYMAIKNGKSFDVDQKTYLSFISREMDNKLKEKNVCGLLNSIHNTLFYFGVRSSLILKYYKYEYLLGLLSHAQFKSYSLDENIIKFVKEEFNKTLNVIHTNMVKTIEVWLLRELYYFKDELENYIHDPKELSETIGTLYKGDKDAFKKIMVEKDIPSFSGTNEEIYFNVRDIFHKSFNLDKKAQFNILLSLSHCNGSMATKYVKLNDSDQYKYRHSDTPQVTFLSDLSNNCFKPEVDVYFYKLTRIPVRTLFS